MMYAENLFVCVALPLCVALLFIRGSTRRFCGYLLCGMAVCLLSAYVSSFLMSATGLNVDDTAVFITPISEECMKLLPLLFYFLVFDPEQDNLFSATVAVGVGFATFENCCYLLSGGADSFSYVLVRGLAVGVMHTVCALAAGTGLNLIKKLDSMAMVGALGVFALTVTYHAVYNLLVSVPGVSRNIGYMIPILTAAIIFVATRLKRKNKQ